MTKRKPEPWRNRIVGYADVAASDLSANPLNARLHPAAQRAALTAVLDDVGFVAPVIVNKRTGLIVDGHLRVEEASARGEAVPVAYVELTEAEEREVLATLDPIGDLANYDRDKMLDLMDGLNMAEPIADMLAAITGVADSGDSEMAAKDAEVVPVKRAWFLVGVPIEQSPDVEMYLTGLRDAVVKTALRDE